VPGWRSHEEIIAWQLSYQLKKHVYALIEGNPRAQRNQRFRDQLDGAASSAPRLIAEGFGRYLPGDFSRYLRDANAELKETFECLRDGVDRGYFTQEQVVPLQRLCKRASKAATRLIAYLKTADAPNEERRRRKRIGPGSRKSTKSPEPKPPEREPLEREPLEPEPLEPLEQKPLEPLEPLEPTEPID
jgi:four helix bundle protein